ncbi:MAG: STAS domain-containing protein [Planctomycetota bacterium]
MATLLTRVEDGILLAYFQDVRIIDQSRINGLGLELNEFLTDPANKKIIVNFQNVSFMSSAMIGKLVQFGKKCRDGKVDLRFCNINENILEVFGLMKLDKVFNLDKDEAVAIKNIKGKGWFG